MRLSHKSLERLRPLAGSKLIRVRSDRIFQDKALYIEFHTPDKILWIESEIVVAEYYGCPEDLSKLKVHEGAYPHAEPVMKDEFQPWRTIKQVRVLNYHIKDGKYDWAFTEAIILELDGGRNLIFEKLDVFSELIEIKENYLWVNPAISYSSCSAKVKKCEAKLVTL